MSKLKTVIEKYLRGRPSFYAFLRPQEAYLFYRRIREMRKPILDFGCGDGFFASTIFKRKFIDAGLDLSFSRIEEAPSTKIYKQTKTYDGMTIPFSANTFGSVISNCVFEHIPDIEGSVKEIHRVLKKNGLLMTTVMCSSWSNNLFGGKILGKKYIDWFNKIQNHVSLFSKKEWIVLFKNTGFEIIEDVDYLYEKAAQKTELYHFFSLFSLLSYTLFKKWQLFPFISKKRINNIEKLIAKDIKNPSACFFVLKKT